jgi:hypothetical protein|tara:strand:- start:243 stop:458 length:216 start_codon:yes stop_codon:yes gene_type:complete
MNINAALAGLGNLAKALVGLGLALIPAALVIDIFYPGTTDIVSNLGDFVESFTGAGLNGLIVLLLVLAIVD